jgi:hypothetical protein
MMPRDEWEEEEAERLLEAVRQRRKALEDFAATLPTLLAAARSDEARAQMQPLADKLNEFLSNFHMNNLDEMERLRLEVTRLAQP